MRAPTRLGLVAAPLALLAACSSKPQSGALRVVVSFGVNSRAQCVKVGATNAAGTVKLSEPIARQGRDQLKVGIERGADLTGQLTLQAHGYAGADCADATLNEDSETKQADIDQSGVQEVAVKLDGPTAAEDADGNHYRAGVDCRDDLPFVHPGQKESEAGVGACGNGLDDDCDGDLDCGDSDCAGQLCMEATACAGPGSCTLGVCTLQQNTCTSPGPCEKAAGASCGADGGCVYPSDPGQACDGGTCRSDKSCGPANGEVLCGDGVDNDLDGLTDCADPDCNTQMCDGGTVVCQQSFSCGSGSCTGQNVPCNPPAGTCLTGGSCSEPTGCSFTVGTVGSDCGNGQSCVADGGCVPAETGALCADGLDNDHDGLTDCADPGCGGKVCDGGNTCTSGATCSGSSCTGGTSTMCNMPPGECFDVTTCQSGVGCVYPVRSGACDGGTCQSDGGCARAATFPYGPSNFDAGLFVGLDAGVSLNCNAAIDTSAVAVRNWCGPVPRLQVINQPGGGGEALLAAASSFNLNAANNLRVTGTRPLIFAVYGDATVSGSILVSNVDGGVPPGGSDNEPNVAAFCSAGAGASVGDGSQTNGGGGGGSFGTAGTDGATGSAGSGNSGGAAGTADATNALAPLRGGCPGGNGGSLPFNGAWGGGAFQLSAAGLLTVNGRIAVPGGSGGRGDRAAKTVCGGGGGGSGGAILLEAVSVQFGASALLTAQGGGGGEGGAINGNSGDPGEAGHTADTQGADGGSAGTTVGGNGSNAATAFFPSTPAQNAPSNFGCGGAGSGGLGIIRLNHFGGACSADAGTFSPALTLNTSCP